MKPTVKRISRVDISVHFEHIKVYRSLKQPKKITKFQGIFKWQSMLISIEKHFKEKKR